MRGPNCPHVLSLGLVWSPDPASDTTHHQGTAIMMTEDLMTTNKEGSVQTFHTKIETLTFLFIPSSQSMSLKGPEEGFMLLCYQSIIEHIYTV